MAYGLEILDRLLKLNVKQELSAAAEQEKDVFADAVRDQLSKGQNSEGNSLPRYVDDLEYFGTYERALQYQNWKMKISPDKSKNPMLMDFYINGYTHDRIDVKIQGDIVDIYNTTAWAESIEEKTGGKAFGVNPTNIAHIWEHRIKPILLQSISQKTGLKISKV